MIKNFILLTVYVVAIFGFRELIFGVRKLRTPVEKTCNETAVIRDLRHKATEASVDQEAHYTMTLNEIYINGKWKYRDLGKLKDLVECLENYKGFKDE